MKPPIITVIGSLSFASGCLVVANNVDNLTAGSRMLERIATENADAPLVFSQLLACLEVAWPVLLMVSLAGATVAWLAEKRLLACVLLLVPLLSTVYALSRLPRPQPSDLWFQRNAGNIECICRVDSVKNKNSLICSSLEMSFPSHRPLSGKTLVTIYGDSQEKQTFEPGQTIAVFGRVTQPLQTHAAWQRNERRKLVGSGIFSKVSTDDKYVKLIRQPGRASSAPFASTRSESTDDSDTSVNHSTAPNDTRTSFSARWTKFWEQGRQEIIKAHANSLGSGKGDLLSSMVLGDRVVKLPKEIKDVFRDVGLSHLLAASGFNLSIVVASSYFIARLLPIKPYFASLFALLATACFVCLAGPSPSVVRAAMLCVFFLAAKLFARKLHSLAALSLVLTIALVVDPLSASDVGLQLSYLATAGIISGAQSAIGRPKAKSITEKLLRWLQDTVSVICLAQLSVLPLQLMYFQYAGVLFLPANLLVDPVVAPVTILGFISSMIAFTLSLLPFSISGSAMVIELIDKLTSLSLDYMLQCASWLASIKGTMIRMGPPVPFATPIYYLCLTYFFYVFPRKHLRSLGGIVLLIGLSILLFRPNIPNETVYLSKDAAILLSTKTGVVLNKDEPDWLGKQLIVYSGVDDVRGTSSLDEPKHLTVKTRRDPNEDSYAEISKEETVLNIRETKDFAIISHLSEDRQKESPLTWGQAQKALNKLNEDRSITIEKPIIVWTKSFKSGILKCKYVQDRDVYFGLVNNWRPLIVSLSPQTSNAITPGKNFYPFQVEQVVDHILVLR